MINKNYLLFYFLFLNILLFGNNNFFIKKYYGNIFGGGKPFLRFENNIDKDNISLLKLILTIDLYNNYSKINITYIIKNISKKQIDFIINYPFISSYIVKKNEDEKTEQLINIHNEYNNFSIKINNQTYKYSINYDSLQEYNIPYKVGDITNIVEGNNIKNNEVIDSYKYNYSFYSVKYSIKPNEKQIINISYITPYYYNEIEIPKNIINSNEQFEDPGLEYDFIEKGNNRYYISEKIFTYYFDTSYSKDINVILSKTINIRSHIIDNSFLYILPKKFKRTGNNYTFSYNYKSTDYDNILIKISSRNSRNVISPIYFTHIPEKKKIGYDTFFYLDKEKDSIIFTYIKENKRNLDNFSLYPFISISEIRIFPQIFTSMKSVSNTNNPVEFEITFSKYEDFKDSQTFYKKISIRDFYNIIKNKNYLIIYKDKPIETRYIKIKILKTSIKDIEKVHINDIIFLE